MRRRALTSLVVAVIAAAIGAGAFQAGVLDRVENETVDKRFSIRGEQQRDDVVVVAIDEATLTEMQNQRWPFDRRYHARVLDRLRKAGVRHVAYDVVFSEATSVADDNALWRAIHAIPGTVLSTTEADRGKTGVLGGEESLRAARARAGHASVNNDDDGAVRRLSYSTDGLDSFAVAAAEQATGRSVAKRAFAGGPAYIDMQGPPQTVPFYSFVDVLRGRVPASKLRGRVVVVGATAPRLNDMHETATSGSGGLTAGPELQANAISTVMRGLPLRGVSDTFALVLIALFALIVPLLRLRLRGRWVAGLTIALAAAYPASTVLAFDAGHVLPFTYPLLALLLSAGGVLGLDAMQTARERRRTRELFSRFVPEVVVADLIEQSGGAPLKGSRMAATVMFCDLRGFTRFAEERAAEDVVAILNRYLTEMSEAVLDEGGTVVSYMGDGIMAVFGSPIEREDHADAAFRAARAILGPRLQGFNRWLASQGLGPFAMGVGLNSGEVMSGNVGSERRLEYAAIGDTTNVAARLEGATKQVPGGLLLSGATYAGLREGRELLSAHGELALAGRERPIETWALAERGDSVVDAAASQTVAGPA